MTGFASEVLIVLLFLFQDGVAVLLDCEQYGSSVNYPVSSMCFHNTVTTSNFILDTYRAKLAENINPCNCTATPSINAPVTLSFTAHNQPGWSGCGNVINIRTGTQSLNFNCFVHGTVNIQIQPGEKALFSLNKPTFSWDERFCITVSADSTVTMTCEGESTQTTTGTTTSTSSTTSTTTTSSTTTIRTTSSTTSTTTPSTTSTPTTTSSTTTTNPTTTTISTPMITTSTMVPTTATTTKQPTTTSTTEAPVTTSTTIQVPISTSATTTPETTASTMTNPVSTSVTSQATTQSSQTTSTMSSSTPMNTSPSSTDAPSTTISSSTPQPDSPSQRPSASPTAPPDGNKDNQKDDSDVKSLPWQAIIPAVAAAFILLIAIAVGCYLYYNRKANRLNEAEKGNSAHSPPYMAFNEGFTQEDGMTEMTENVLYKSADDTEEGNTEKPINSSHDDVNTPMRTSSGDQTSGTFVRCSVVPPGYTEQSFPTYAVVDKSSQKSQSPADSTKSSGETENKVLY